MKSQNRTKLKLSKLASAYINIFKVIRVKPQSPEPIPLKADVTDKTPSELEHLISVEIRK